MGTVTGSPLVRKHLGRLLVQVREAAGRTHADVARMKIASRATMSALEHGTRTPNPGTVLQLARYYRLDPEMTEVLASLADGAQEEGWWESYGSAVPADLTMYTGLEASASAIDAYDTSVIHGLLQTEGYAAALISTLDELSSDVVLKRVEFRVARQRAVLDRDDPARLHVILGEAALLMAVGSPEVMAGQRTHLLELAGRGVRIDVIRSAAPPKAHMIGTFTVLRFDTPDDPDAVYIEQHLSGARYMDKPEQLAEYRRVFGLLGQTSIPIEEYLR